MSFLSPMTENLELKILFWLILHFVEFSIVFLSLLINEAVV